MPKTPISSGSTRWNRLELVYRSIRPESGLALFSRHFLTFSLQSGQMDRFLNQILMHLLWYMWLQGRQRTRSSGEARPTLDERVETDRAALFGLSDLHLFDLPQQVFAQLVVVVAVIFFSVQLESAERTWNIRLFRWFSPSSSWSYLWCLRMARSLLATSLRFRM